MSKERSIHIYCMPGMAASPKIFEFIKLPSPYVIHTLSWIPPLKNEPLANYALRMCERIKHPNPFLLGVSFGGILVQEMAKHIKVKKVIIVSSIKNNSELPIPMKMAQKTNAHKLLPMQWIKSLDALALFAFGKGIQRRLEMYQKYLSEDELLLCDTERERLVMQRELVDLGMLSEMDLIINNFSAEAKQSAAKINGFNLSTWISLLFSKK